MKPVTHDLTASLAHYTAMAREAQALRRPTIQVEDRDFARTGTVFSQPWCGLQDGFGMRDCGALDAPHYTPSGGLATQHVRSDVHSSNFYALANVARAEA